ncbi:MAG: glycosyltransferase family 9 protein [Candidatus Omnitrophota bacterium]
MSNKVITLCKIVIRRILIIFPLPLFIFFIGEPVFWILGRRWNRKKIDMPHLKRVLVVRLDGIGDVVLTTPFLRELRKNLPNARITLIVRPEALNLVKLCPYVDEILTHDWKEPGIFAYLMWHISALKFSIFHLWKRRFDLSILPRWDVDNRNSSFIIYFSGARLRVGYSENVRPEKIELNKRYDILFTHVISDKTLKHEVEHNLDVITFIGGKIERDNLELWLKEDDSTFAQSLLRRFNIDAKCFFVGIGPAAQENLRMWPKERYLDMLDWFLKETASKIVLLGNKNERLIGDYIENNIKKEFSDRIINIMGETTLRQTAGLLKYCRFYLGNDTGVMHIAAAMKIPVIEISSWSDSGNKFSAKSPFRFAPWKTRCVIVNPRHPLSPCVYDCVSSESHCIAQVTIEDVKNAIKKIIKGH